MYSVVNKIVDDGTVRLTPFCIQGQAIPLCMVKRDTIFIL